MKIYYTYYIQNAVKRKLFITQPFSQISYLNSLTARMQELYNISVYWYCLWLEMKTNNSLRDDTPPFVVQTNL